MILKIIICIIAIVIIGALYYLYTSLKSVENNINLDAINEHKDNAVKEIYDVANNYIENMPEYIAKNMKEYNKINNYNKQQIIRPQYDFSQIDLLHSNLSPNNADTNVKNKNENEYYLSSYTNFNVNNTNETKNNMVESSKKITDLISNKSSNSSQIIESSIENKPTVILENQLEDIQLYTREQLKNISLQLKLPIYIKTDGKNRLMKKDELYQGIKILYENTKQS